MKRLILLSFFVLAAFGLVKAHDTLQAEPICTTPSAPIVIPYAPTVTFNTGRSRAPILAFRLELTGAVRSSTLTGAAAGQLLVFQILEDAKGGRPFVWPANFKGAIPIAASGGEVSVQAFYFDGHFAWAISPGAQY